MGSNQSISVIVPVKDEEDNVAPVYQEVSSVLKKLGLDFEIIFVNDGSTDSSLQKALALREKDSRVKVIDFYKNFGQSAAMMAGFELASKDLVCYIDCDQQIDFSELPLFLEEISKGADSAVGWRHKRKDSFFKTFYSRIARTLRQYFLGTQLHDYGCPFKVFRKECLEGLELYGEMHRYIPPLLRWRGFKVVEVKISHKPRERGLTKYNWTRVPKGFLDMIVVWFWQKYSARPLHIFGGFGLAAIIFGLVLGVTLIVLRLEGRISLVNSSFPLFTAFLLITGITFFCFGLISDMLMKIYYSTEHKKPYTIKKMWK